MDEPFQNGPPPTRPQCPVRSSSGFAIQCVLEEGHAPVGRGPDGVPLVHNFGGLGPYSPHMAGGLMAKARNEIAPGAPRYRIRGEGPSVVIVSSTFLAGVELAEDWVWLIDPAAGTEGGFLAAHRDWLVPVLTNHDMRTISGVLRLSHGIMGDWVEQDQRWEIPVVDIEMMRGGPLRLRRADITEIRHVLGKMLAEMPPDPLMPG
jgi:hypothetical protein